MNDVKYIHGTEESEQARLALLNRLTNEPFIKYLNLTEPGLILEVGSGLGLLCHEIATQNPSSRIFGIEYATAQLANVDQGIGNLNFVQADAHTLPFSTNCFDTVYCRYVLEHLANPQMVLEEIFRVLKPGGKVYLQENNILINVFDPECPHFNLVWQQFALLQHKLGGDAQIGKKLFSLLKYAGFIKIELSLQPELH